MASSSKKKTTMAKLNREAAVRERRQLKKMKKDARKHAAAMGETETVADGSGIEPSDGEVTESDHAGTEATSESEPAPAEVA